MKHQPFLLLLIMAALINSCATSTNENLNPMAEISPDKTLPANSADLGIIPDSVLYFNLVLQPDNYSWRDFDHYYRVTLPKYHSNQAYTENLKKATISGMINTGKLAEINDMKVVEWYTEEWLSLPLADPDISIKWLRAMKGYWSETKIKQRAELAHQTLVRYVQENLKNPDKVLADQSARYQRLKDFAGSFE